MTLIVKEVENKLDSVRKERQGAISIIEQVVKKAYNEMIGIRGSITGNNYVSLRMYGSMASGLAIDTSDVDLSVTGLNFNGNRELLIREMRSLYE